MAKRLFDIILVLLAAPIAVPLGLAVAALVRATMGAPVLFAQARPGLRGEPFVLYKFRTMSAGRDAQGDMLPDRARLTQTGRLLRKTSLDELPELWNVLKGDMSLVGPRPLLMDYLPRYNKAQARRHEVHPGLTGWAQVNGRNALSWEDRFALDVWYVDNRTLWLDAVILARTVWMVLSGKGITAPGHATMPPFEGKGGGR